jgi:hypothetical protein
VRRFLIAVALLLGGTLLFAVGISAIAGSEIAMGAVTLLFGALAAAFGIYLIASGISLVAHDTGITDQIKRWVD